MPTAQRVWHKSITDLVKVFVDMTTHDNIFNGRFERKSGYSEITIQEIFNSLEYHYKPDPDEPNEFEEEEAQLWKRIWKPIIRLRTKAYDRTQLEDIKEMEINVFTEQLKKQLKNYDCYVIDTDNKKLYYDWDVEATNVFERLLVSFGYRYRTTIKTLSEINANLQRTNTALRQKCSELDAYALQLLIERRQIAPHLKQIIYDTKSKDDEFKCCICLNKPSLEDYRLTHCGHDYCSECVDKINTCSICRVKL